MNIVGIDLGTTHSLVAVVENGIPKIIPTHEGQRLLPSVVNWQTKEVGYQVKSELWKEGVISKEIIQKESHIVTSAKRLLVDPTQSAAQKTHAVDVSSEILKKLKQAAETYLGEPIQHAVITVPAHFNDQQRQATRLAGQLAGLQVVRMINEPTAAALAYGIESKHEGLVAVYDFGGGTFDVSLLRLQNGVFEVIATHGDTELGGDDIDFKIVADCCDQYPELKKESRPLKLYAEKIKIALASSDVKEASFDYPSVLGKKYHYHCTQEHFQKLIAPLIQKTFDSCQKALADAKIKPESLTDIVMVGGSTKIQAVQTAVAQFFNRPVNTSQNPDEVVALGAALQAEVISKGRKDLLLLDVVPLTLGMEMYGGVFEPMIKRNTKIPTFFRETFTNFMDLQTGVDIHVLQGERELVKDNQSLARFKLSPLDPLPAGFHRIEVTFMVDADGILQVFAKDLRTGLAQSIDIKQSHGLSAEMVQSLLKKAEQNKIQDQQLRRLIEVRNELQPLLKAMQKNLPQIKGFVQTCQLSESEYIEIENDYHSLLSL
jgi:molecular chaperone DnaK (HSP70)